MNIGSRIKKIRTSKNMTQGELADFLGIPQSNLFRYENNTGQLNSDKINKFYQLGININWLITGEGEMFRDASGEITTVKKKHLPENIEETIYVKRLDVKASAGVGFINPLEQSNIWIGLPESFIRPYNPLYISLLEATGSSMEPVIRSGDLLLVSEQDTELLSERIYIIRMGEELKVKRIVRLGNGNIVVWSENESFGREEFTPQQWEEYGMSIVARVVKIIKEV